MKGRQKGSLLRTTRLRMPCVSKETSLRSRESQGVDIEVVEHGAAEGDARRPAGEEAAGREAKHVLGQGLAVPACFVRGDGVEGFRAAPAQTRSSSSRSYARASGSASPGSAVSMASSSSSRELMPIYL